MKKAMIVLSAWAGLSIGLALFQSCEPCNDGPFTVRLVSIDANVKRITGIELPGLHQIPYYTVETYVARAHGIRYDSVGIDLLNTVEMLARYSPGYFFNQAFACDPVVRFDLLRDLTITSSQDYGDSFPAGSDLGEIMTVRNGYQLRGEHPSTFSSNAELDSGNFFLTFDFPPARTNTHDIIITYKLSDGREFSTLIQGLKITA
jgi:hypothetical protein